MDLVYSLVTAVHETDLGGSGGTQKLEFAKFLYNTNKGVMCVFSTDGSRRDGMDSEECIKQSNPNPIWWEMCVTKVPGPGERAWYPNNA